MSIFFFRSKLQIPKLIVGGLFLVLAMTCVHPGKVAAISDSGFQPSHIIDNNIFTNDNAMSVQDIQNFLNAKVGTCDTYGTQPSTHWDSSASRYYTHAEWGALNGNSAPFTCINEYVENTSTLQNNYSNPSASIPGSISAAQIIWNAAQTYQINPEVILTTLQKEQGLVTDNWPWYSEFQYAMGYSCPDSSGCSGTYADFYKQVDGAAWQFRHYLTSPGAYNYWTGNNYIQYNPNASCGGSIVDIQNSATAALYIYTPYQPDPSALSYKNGTSGTYDSCSSFGNLNFWYYFNTWFGPSLDQNNFCPEITNGGQAGLNGCPDIQPGDFNGDGKTDLAQIWSGGVNTWMSNGDGTYTVSAPYVPFSNYNMTGGIQWITGDFNGDGKTDLAQIWSGGVNVWLSNGNGTYTVESPFLPSPGYDMTNALQWITGDFNGDGKTDLAEITDGGVIVWLSDGNGQFTVEPVYLPFSGYNMTNGEFLAGDFNDNGKTDLVHIWSGGVNTWFSNGNGAFNVPATYIPSSNYDMNGGFYWKVADVTGNGKDDLLHLWSGGVNTWMSNGDGTYTVHSPFLPFPNYNMTNGYEFLAGDYNGSGKVGLAHIWSGGVNTWMSNGDGTYTVPSPYVPFSGYYTGGGEWY